MLQRDTYMSRLVIGRNSSCIKKRSVIQNNTKNNPKRTNCTQFPFRKDATLKIWNKISGRITKSSCHTFIGFSIRFCSVYLLVCISHVQ